MHAAGCTNAVCHAATALAVFPLCDCTSNGQHLHIQGNNWCIQDVKGETNKETIKTANFSVVEAPDLVTRNKHLFFSLYLLSISGGMRDTLSSLLPGEERGTSLQDFLIIIKELAGYIRTTVGFVLLQLGSRNSTH